MTFRRYGKFQLKDCYSAWIGCSILFFLGVVQISIYFLDIGMASFPLVSIPLLIGSIIWFCAVLIRYNERFALEGNVIHTFRFLNLSQITIPPNPVLVIAYADMHEAIGTQSTILSHKYSVSILPSMPLNELIGQLHSRHAKIYTNSSIEILFAQYVYSFVCSPSQLDLLLQNVCSLIVIPESLASQFPFLLSKEKVYIDSGY